MYRDQDTVNQARVSIGLPSAFLTGSKCKIAYIYLNIKGKKFKQNSCFTIEKNVVLKSCWLHTIFVIVSLIVFHVELVILLPLVHIKILLLPSYLVYGLWSSSSDNHRGGQLGRHAGPGKLAMFTLDI